MCLVKGIFYIRLKYSCPNGKTDDGSFFCFRPLYAELTKLLFMGGLKRLLRPPDFDGFPEQGYLKIIKSYLIPKFFFKFLWFITPAGVQNSHPQQVKGILASMVYNPAAQDASPHQSKLFATLNIPSSGLVWDYSLFRRSG